MTQTSPRPPAYTGSALPTNPVGRMLRQVGTDTTYVLVNFPVALIAFIVVITLFSVGVGLLVTVIGIPILVGCCYAARGFADLERVWLPGVVRREIRRPRYRHSTPEQSRWRRLTIPLADGQSWLDVTHATLKWIFVTIGFVFVVTWWAGALGGLSSWIWLRYIPHTMNDPNNQDLNQLLGLSDTLSARVWLQTAFGAIFLITLPPVVRASAMLPAQFSRVLLTGLAEVQNRISGLEERREAAVSAEATALRRLERDIHDGPQQRLVRLAMDLGRARQQLDRDPNAARATLDEALGQTRETLDELRALSRGIAPPILSDRGLAAALAALAGRSTVPVGLTVTPDLGRLPPAVENTAYFVVAESLTNVAKHSDAGMCGVDVTRGDGMLLVTIVDDGVGGAHVAKGHGLAGLADRVRAAGGRLSVVSPVGGPTEIRAELPCV